MWPILIKFARHFCFMYCTMQYIFFLPAEIPFKKSSWWGTQISRSKSKQFRWEKGPTALINCLLEEKVFVSASRGSIFVTRAIPSNIPKYEIATEVSVQDSSRQPLTQLETKRGPKSFCSRKSNATPRVVAATVLANKGQKTFYSRGLSKFVKNVSQLVGLLSASKQILEN